MYRLNCITIARLRLLIACCVMPICVAMSDSVRSLKKSSSTSQRSDFDRHARACPGQASKAEEATESNRQRLDRSREDSCAECKAYAQSCRERESVPVSTRWWAKALKGTPREGS